MKKSGLLAYGLGEWEAPKLTESERLALEVGLTFSGKKLTKKKGRPSKSVLGNVDSFRAFRIWELVNFFPEKQLYRHRHRALIAIVQQSEELTHTPLNQRLFPLAGKFDSSVSRGKRNLSIDHRWRSKVCEKIKGI